MTRLVIAAFDGLLPQQVNPDLMPTVNSLAETGVRFKRHHAVYPTVTRTNAASMVTGCYPGKHGIPANTAVFADHDPHIAMSVLEPQLAAMATNPETPVLFVPTIGEMLASAGMTHISIVGGTSGNAYTHFPRAAEAGRGGVIHPEFSLPVELGRADAEMLGPWPDASVPSIDRVRRVAESACRFVIPEINPELMFVWFSEPDTSNHAHGLGSEQSDRGTSEADAALGRILETLANRGDEPDVMVISDHGYSMISSAVDVPSELQAAGFVIDQGEGSLIVGNNGGSTLFNMPGAGNPEIESLTRWLQEQPWVGSVFSSLDSALKMGALPLADGMIDGLRAPHFAVSMAWNDEPAGNGFTGTAWNGSQSPVGAGMHGSASPYELRNTLIAGGPSFRQSVTSSLPSGNVDLTPTALRLLGQDVPSHMDGRILEEALADGPDPTDLPVSNEDVTGAKFQIGPDSTDTGRYFARKVTVSGHAYLESAGFQHS